MISRFLSAIAGIDLPGMLFALAAIGLVVYLWRVDQRKGNKFFLVDFVTDAAGRADKYSLGYVLILCVGCWVMWYLTLHNRLTEWFVTAFLAAFVVGAIAKTGANVFERTRDATAAANPAPGTSTETTTVAATTTKTEGK